MARSRRDHASVRSTNRGPSRGRPGRRSGQVEVVADQHRLSELDVVAQAAVGVREHGEAYAGRGGRPDRVRDRGRSVSLVEVGPAEVQQHPVLAQHHRADLAAMPLRDRDVEARAAAPSGSSPPAPRTRRPPVPSPTRGRRRPRGGRYRSARRAAPPPRAPRRTRPGCSPAQPATRRRDDGPTLIPMSITEIRCHRLTAPLHTPFVTALRRTDHLETTVVEVVDDDGCSGFGEAPQVWRVTGESLAGAEACLSGPLADVVRGRSTSTTSPTSGAELARRGRRQLRRQGRDGRRAARPGLPAGGRAPDRVPRRLGRARSGYPPT